MSDTNSIYFFEVFAEEQAILETMAPRDWRCHYFKNTIQESPVAELTPALLCLRTQSVIPQEWSVHLKAVLSRSKGYDHLVAYQRQTGSNAQFAALPSYCAEAVAEHALTMLLMLSRNMKQQMLQFSSFDRDGLTGSELSSLNVLIVGVGSIGYATYRLCHGLCGHVKGCDIHPTHEDVEYIELDEGLSWADVVIVSASLTESSRGLLNEDRLRNAASKGMFLVNVARGEITPLADMRLLLDLGIVKGLAMDVFPDENFLGEQFRSGYNQDSCQSLAVVHELSDRPNVVLTPHNAFNTHASVVRKCQETVRAWTYYFNNQSFFNCLDKG
jgi:D-lactate dehydrogenase